MIRIAALNDGCSDETDSESDIQESTKEAQEAEAFTLYNNALSLQRTGKHSEAQTVYERLLLTTLLKQESSNTTACGEALVRPGAILKYSTLKNLASLASEKNNLDTAMKYYLKAVELDRSDVTVWYHMGKIALELCQLSLARLAFEEALTCNPNHWPSMDILCTVLYALNDYYGCMYLISKTLTRDGSYTKGLVLRDKMYQEQPTLKRECEILFQTHSFFNVDQTFKKEEADKIINEAMEIRRKRRALTKPAEVPVIKLPKPLTSLTWKCLGESLLSVYELVDRKKPDLSFGHQVQLTYQFQDIQVDQSKHEGDSSVLTDNTSPSDTGIEADMTMDTATSTTLTLASSSATITTTSTTVVTTTTTPSDAQHPDNYSVKQKEEESMEVDLVIGAEKSKRGPKRKRSTVPNEDNPAAKRRSQRVRNTVKKKEEAVDYKDLLRNFLPSSIRDADEDEDDEGEGMEGDSSENIKDREIVQYTNSGCQKSSDTNTFIATEETDVKGFLEKYKNNNGIVDLMIQFCISLAQKCSNKWPPGLIDLYISAYGKLRNHLSLPSYLCKSVSNQRIKEVGLMSLVTSELQLEKWLATKLKLSASSTMITSSSSPDPSPSSLVSNPGQVFQSDLQYLEGLCNFREILGDIWLQFAIRVYWLKSRYLMLHGKMDLALDSFDVCDQLLTPEEGDMIPVVVSLPNCKDNIITLGQIKKQVESLQRCQSLEEVHRLYETSNYSKVVELLLPTLNQPTSKGKMIDIGKTIPERPAQLLLLLDALYQVKDYQLCVSCSVNTVNEALQQLTSSTSMTAKENWVSTLTKVFKFIDKCLCSDTDTLSKMPRNKLVHFTNVMIRVIEMAMESAESTDLPIISTLLPWIILYRLIKYEEDQLKLIQVKLSDKSEETRNNEEVKLMPSSLMLLYTAHEYLGRRGWCCNSDGYLLTFYVDVLQQELERRVGKDALRQDLCLAVEQCFYCLYGHPNKKAKARHLQDHGVEEVALTWEKAVFVFDYFKPKTVPEFDSYKTSSMSGELENLLLKISKVIPSQDTWISLDLVQCYIESNTDQVPTLPPDVTVTLPVVKELYYLLADYYFKNKEWGKAIKFYMHDICVCPERFDSWAGMALARSSRLEAKLSSCDVKNEGAMQKNAQAAIRCFQRALEIDATNCTLWIECGSLAYALHSHSSRQLKQQKTQMSLSPEMVNMLQSRKEEMLVLAKKCFTKAKDCEGDGEEEEWLIHYMLGKIAEKQHDSPKVYVQHYKEAGVHLYEDHACYPKKIHYHNPPDLAIEALEVHFRLHASMLKLLEDGTCTDIDFDHLEEQIKDCANGPFAKGQQKEADNISSSSPSSQDIPKPTFTATPLDHDYTAIHKTSKHKLEDVCQAQRVQDSEKPSESRPGTRDSPRSGSESSTSVESEKKVTREDQHQITMTDDRNKQPPQTDAGKTTNGEENPPESVQTCAKERTVEEKQSRLVALCLDALKLCLSRFPQHYKSLYRMANLYLCSPTHKNLVWCRDLLLGTGSTPWQQLAHMPAQGLFSERNKSNFFNGIWRIPVDEIDRPGSFPSHMHRSVNLLLEILLQLKDYKVLFQVSTQLQRTPDQGKKYLRDMDRILLAKLAYDYTLTVLEENVSDENVTERDSDLQQLLQDTFRVWQYGSNKLQSQMDSANNVLGLVYKAYKHNQVEEGASLLEQAIKFCSQYSTIHKTPQTPTHGDCSFWSPTTSRMSSSQLKEDAENSGQSKMETHHTNAKDTKDLAKMDKSESSDAQSVFKKKEIPKLSDDSNSLNEVESIVSNVDIPTNWSSDLLSLPLSSPHSQVNIRESSPVPKYKKSPLREGASSSDQRVSFQKCFEKSILQTSSSSPTPSMAKVTQQRSGEHVNKHLPSKPREKTSLDNKASSSIDLSVDQNISETGQKQPSDKEVSHSKSGGFAGLTAQQLTGLAESRDFGTMVSQLVESLVGSKSESHLGGSHADEADEQTSVADRLPLFGETDNPMSEDHGIDPDSELQLAYDLSQFVGSASSTSDIMKAFGDSDEDDQ